MFFSKKIFPRQNIYKRMDLEKSGHLMAKLGQIDSILLRPIFLAVEVHVRRESCLCTTILQPINFTFLAKNVQTRLYAFYYTFGTFGPALAI